MQRIALCIGINDYPGIDMDLKGCVNDAQAWAAELASRGFTVAKLLDSQATKDAMVQGFRQAIGAARAGDLVVISFSGHGTYEIDLDGDDQGGFDQALCPHDLKALGEALVDDEIHDLFKQRAAGVRIVLISDSCHSGSVTREAERPADPSEDRKRFLPMAKWMPAPKLALARTRATKPGMAVKGALMATGIGAASDDLLLSGCGDAATDFSYDATIAGKLIGAFTFYALKSLRGMPAGATYSDWHKRIRAALPSPDYRQSPQIFGSAAAQTLRIFA